MLPSVASQGLNHDVCQPTLHAQELAALSESSRPTVKGTQIPTKVALLRVESTAYRRDLQPKTTTNHIMSPSAARNVAANLPTKATSGKQHAIYQ